jgi:hypothetical protein
MAAATMNGFLLKRNGMQQWKLVKLIIAFFLPLQLHVTQIAYNVLSLLSP